LPKSPLSWKPALDGPLQFTGTYQLTSRSEVINLPLVVLHFVLAGIDAAGSPLRLVHQYMSSYLKGDLLRFEEVVFDLTTPALVRSHSQAMNRLVSRLSK
jgi:hypothetical protein